MPEASLPVRRAAETVTTWVMSLTDESGIAERYMRLCATEVVIRPDGTEETIYPPLLTSDYEYIYTTEEIARQIDNNN